MMPPWAPALLAVATVAFFAEIGISAALGRPLHRFNDTVAAIPVNALTLVTSGVGKLLLLALYVPLRQAAALWTWEGTALEWLVAWLAYDFFAYWFHRWSHETNLGWAIHVVHHQSEELNLATPMRTAPLRAFVDWPTILPLALLDVPVPVLGVLYLLHVAGQTVLHVRWVPRLGPLEGWLNTPSAHRVHHGCQPGYQDANYGAHLVVWDRLFGTYVPEQDAPIYGVTRPPGGWDPLRATVSPFLQVWEDSRGWSALDRVRVWFARPGWRPSGEVVRGPVVPRRDTTPPARWAVAVALALSLGSALLFVLIRATPQWGLAAHLLMGATGLLGMRALGQVLDRSPSRARAVRRRAPGA